MSSLFVQGESESLPIDQQRVRQLFSFPEKVAESHFLRREIADRMHERLSLIKMNPQYVLDVGCGEGYDLPVLHKSFPASHIVGLDMSYPMLTEAAQHTVAPKGLFNRWIQREKRQVQLICADFASLPLASGLMDMIWSNLVLHWHPGPDQVFQECMRVLRPDGLLMFSCFGSNTFFELKEAFASVDQFQHILPFMEMHDLGDMLVSTGFSSPVLDREVITVTYSSLDKLFSDIRAFGGNAMIQRRRGLMGRQAYRQVVQFLENTKNAEGLFSLQFEIIYGHAFRTPPGQSGREESVIHFMPRT